MSRLSVLLTTEGTYPYHRGGVSTWCHALTHELSEIDFTLLAVTMHPYLESQYALAPNVRGVVTVPLWGTEDPAEYGDHASFPDYLQRRWSTTRKDVEQEYLPSCATFLAEVVEPSLPARALGLTLLRMHQHFRHFDYHRTQTHSLVWDVFVDTMRSAWRKAQPNEPPPSLTDLADASRVLHRLLLPLAIETPRVDLTHSAAAAFCGLPCIIAKLRYNTPYLLTEHGVYLREQYLNLGRSIKSMFVRWFLFRLINTINHVNYAFADQISPVCQYNTRWEVWRHAEPERIRVIYNGVNPEKFRPGIRTPHDRPTVVNVGLIFPLKGQLDLIEAAALVRHSTPNVEFRFYGSPSDEDYYRECRQRIEELSLQNTVVFAGTTKEPWLALQQADVVALASVSEAFPYALVEAMLTRAAIVATDVGGVREALGDAGLLVYPRQPVALAEAIGTLLRWPEGRERFGARARDRALRWFTEQRFVDAYRTSYDRLVQPPASEATEPEEAGWIGDAQQTPALAIA
ncbi:MAG TPA: GT4 family glycosyltransferase PelF [Vicinamibacterales bacterium]|jgi:glycosyltransferase involved in cell wall biosynthesis|nr:GT4 family glycosyltransferase PelF [Vicinamibacterales bacterium]